MAIYKFRVRFEDYDDVVRDIEIKAKQTFQDFHDAINQAIGFDGKLPFSFYLSDENWKKGKEITNKPEKDGIAPSLKDSKLTAFINDPHQKIYCVMEGSPEWDFQIEMIKITNEEPRTEYPRCVRSVGTAPKQYGISKIELKDPAFSEELKYIEPGSEGDEEGDLGEDVDTILDEDGAELAGDDDMGFGEEPTSTDPEAER